MGQISLFWVIYSKISWDGHQYNTGTNDMDT